MKLVAPLFVLVAITVSAGPISASRPLCQPDPETRKALDAVGTPEEVINLSQEDWAERVELLETALTERPDDLFLHQRLQDLARFQQKSVGQQKRQDLLARYQALRAEHPDEPLYHYLYSRLTNDPEAGRLAAAAAVHADPDFPWGHLALAVKMIRGRRFRGGQEDSAQGSEEEEKLSAAEHLARFHELCPDQLYETLRYSAEIGEDSWWRERLPALRDRIRQDPEPHLRALPSLWALEFRVTEPARYGEVRRHVAQDVDVVEALGSETETVLDILQQGCELAGMEEKAAELEAKRSRAFPCSGDAVRALLKELNEEQTGNGEEIPEPERATAARARVAKTGEWVARCPDDLFLWLAHFGALDDIEESAPEEILAAGERAVELYRRWSGLSAPSGYAQVARVLVERGLAPDRAIELLNLEEDEERAQREDAEQLLERLPAARRRRIEHSFAYDGLNRELLAARARVAAGKAAEAGSMLEEIRARLEELDPDADADAEDQEIVVHAALESAYWSARADLAEATGRKADALAYLLRAKDDGPAVESVWLNGPGSEEIRDRALALWKELGGGAESFVVLERSGSTRADEAIAEVSPWSRETEPLPPFELSDLSGETWSSEKLRGKAVFVNAWATWCGPCRKELPLVQALHERLAGRDDVLVVTLNKDTNPGTAARMIGKEGYSFPVLLAYDYLSEEAKVFSIPRSWILASDGTVLYQQIGFSPHVDEEEWLVDVEERLEEASGDAGG